jgi:phenylacetate-CoA ligase
VVGLNLPGQRCVPYLPEDRLRTSRDRRLRHIVSYAADSVPYYRDLFRRERIDPREIRSAEDLKRLPLIDREVVRRDPRRFVSTSRRGRRSIMFLTSGSSGTPLPVFHDPYSLLANIAHGERERSVVARLCGKSLGYRELYILYRGSTTEHVWEFYRQHTFIPVRPKRLLLSILEPIDRVVDALNRFRPEVVISYGSYLDNLFRLLSARGIRPHPPRMLIYSGDAMTDDGKRLIEDGFGIPVHSIYNAVEAFKIGFSCEAGTGFHLHEDLCHVRVVTPSGRTADSDERGEVVISNLVNRGSVLLNYRLGDVASMRGRGCACGRTLQLLSELEGRLEDTIFLPDGRFIHPRAVWMVFKRTHDVLKYQLIQHEFERFELRLVTVDRQAYSGVLRAITSALRDLLGHSATIDCERYDDLHTPRGGKFKTVISLCGPGRPTDDP